MRRKARLYQVKVAVEQSSQRYGDSSETVNAKVTERYWALLSMFTFNFGSVV